MNAVSSRCILTPSGSPVLHMSRSFADSRYPTVHISLRRTSQPRCGISNGDGTRCFVDVHCLGALTSLLLFHLPLLPRDASFPQIRRFPWLLASLIFPFPGSLCSVFSGSM